MEGKEKKLLTGERRMETNDRECKMKIAEFFASVQSIMQIFRARKDLMLTGIYENEARRK